MSVFCPQCGAPANEGATMCEYCGAAIATQPQAQPQIQQVVYAQPSTVNPERANWPVKSKTTAGILALLLGGWGVHKFYLGQTGKGVAYLLLCWTYVPSILALIEGIRILCASDEDFQTKYQCRIG